MILSKRVSFHGEELDEIHEAIVIRSIDTGATQEALAAVDTTKGWGQRMTGQHWQTKDVTVKFAINIPKRQMALRREIFDAVCAWANQKGWLRVNYIERKQLRVDKVILPAAGDPWDWTADYTIIFRAYNIPFWTDRDPVTVKSGTAASGVMYIDVGGSVESSMEADFVNRSGKTINNFRIRCGENTIRLSGLNMGGSATLRIYHGVDDLLKITVNNQSVYDCYTGADDLFVTPGRTRVEFEADRAGILTAYAYGRYV